MVGTQLGRYRILNEIGAGGMGVVYRAHDERLDRVVAIKVLPTGSLSDEVARRRFQKEALALSKLNHPNVAILYDFETQAGADLLVMEEVSGVSLETRLASGPLKQAEVIKVGQQLAEALNAAHHAGILHRDLKPGNLRLTHDGRLKVLDFGLASSLHPVSVSKSTASVSDFGPTAGTLAYMAPEQLSGEEPDLRSDIYSAGTVLFEMATGHHPFESRSGAALVADVLHKAAPLARTFVLDLSPELDRIIGKCLEKNPDDRYQSARELAVDLRRMEYASAATVEIAAPKRKAVLSVMIGLAVAAAAGIGFLAFALLSKRNPPLPSPSQYVQITNFTYSASSPVVSPDGKMMAFIGGEGGNVSFSGLTTGQIYIKLLPDGDPVQLTSDSRQKMDPRFSPDGSLVAYTVRETSYDTWTVPVLGARLASLWLPNASGLTWTEKGSQPRLLYSEMTGLAGQMAIVVSTESRTQHHVVYMPPETGMAHRSYLSPDGKQVLLVEMDATQWLPCRLVPLDGSSTGRQVGPMPSHCTEAAWSPDGKWMYFSANAGNGFHIWRQRFPEGKPEQVTFGTAEEAGVAFAPDGKSFLTSIGTSQSAVWVHDRNGDHQITSEGYAVRPSFSPDGKKLFYVLRGPGVLPMGPPQGTLWVRNLETGESHRLFPESQIVQYAISRDSQRVVFLARDEQGTPSAWLANLDGRSEPRRLTSMTVSRASFGPPGEVIFDAEGDQPGRYRIKEDGSQLQKLLGSSGRDLMAISQDGQWLAYGGEDQNLTAVMLQPLTGGPSRVLCKVCYSRGGADAGLPPIVSWSANGKFLYLWIVGGTYAIPLRPGQVVPPLPPGGFQSKEQMLAVPGTVRILADQVFPGADPSVYAFIKASVLRNIYRIPVQ